MNQPSFIREYVAQTEERRSESAKREALELAEAAGLNAPQIDGRVKFAPVEDYGDIEADESEDRLPVERRGLKLKDMPTDEMPREKMSELGPQALTDSELLAVLLGSGTSRVNVKDLALDLLTEFDGLESMSRASIAALMNCKGIGLAKSSQLAAAFEVARRLRVGNASDAGSNGGKSKIGASMGKPHAVADMMRPLLMDCPQEELWVLYLSRRLRYRGKSRVYIGNLDRIEISPGVVMSGVVERREPCFTIVHNHPSGDCEPSTSDIATTKRLVQAAKQLDLTLVDHVIVAASGYTSLRMSRLVEFE